MKPYSEQIAKLPKWAQDHIRDLDFQRQQAVTALNEFVDQQKPTERTLQAVMNDPAILKRQGI